MHALRIISVYVLTLVTFLAIDAVWLGLIASGMYKRELGHLLAPNVRWGAAAVFYVIYVAGVLVLVVLPNLDATLARAVLLGAVFGLVAYATYDLTNLATLQRWPIGVTLIDLAWGAFLTGATAAAGWAFGRWLLR
jgi:uncharacterized membrane protein